MPALIELLGYNPLRQATTMAGMLVWQRTTLELTQKEAAARIGVDQGTLARWERGKREPAGGAVLVPGTCGETAGGVDFSTGMPPVLACYARAINFAQRRFGLTFRIDNGPTETGPFHRP